MHVYFRLAANAKANVNGLGVLQHSATGDFQVATKSNIDRFIRCQSHDIMQLFYLWKIAVACLLLTWVHRVKSSK